MRFWVPVSHLDQDGEGKGGQGPGSVKTKPALLPPSVGSRPRRGTRWLCPPSKDQHSPDWASHCCFNPNNNPRQPGWAHGGGLGGPWDCPSAGSLAKHLQVDWLGTDHLHGKGPPGTPTRAKSVAVLRALGSGSWAPSAPETHLLHRGSEGVPKF